MRKSSLLPFAVLAAACSFPWSSSLGEPPTDLRCEYVSTPLGVDIENPRLSWRFVDAARGARQSAFRILVATAPGLLADEKADVWDSGRVERDESVHVVWGGPRLASATRYWWTVRTWNAAGAESAFAAPTWFETGLLRTNDRTGLWIGDGQEPPTRAEDHYRDRPAPLLRRTFRVDGEPLRARLYVCGLGFHEARLNGRRVGDELLQPAWTRYSSLVPYAVHDVTSYVRDGENALGVMIGRGWYDPLPLRLWGRLDLRTTLATGQPKLWCVLEVVQRDGRIVRVVSDRSWRTAPGPVLRDNLYLGERFAAAAWPAGWDEPGFDDRAWRRADVVAAPGGELRCLPIPPVRQSRTVRAVAVTSPQPGMQVVDFGENFAGAVRLAVTAPAGTAVVLRYAEELRPDGTIDPTSTVAAQVNEPGKGGPGAPPVAWQEDTFVCRGGGRESFEPRFTCHGFRYVEVTGLPDPLAAGDIEGLVWHADLRRVSSFECSDPLCNRIDEVVVRTLLSNASSVLSDCPARERFGYGGDMVASATAYQAVFDMATMHRKAVEDFARDARLDGGLPECAPDVGVNESGLTPDTGPLGWMLAHPYLVHRAWTEYGDRRLVEEQYETVRRLVTFCRDRSPENLAVACFGDHGNIGFNPSPLMATVAYHRMVSILVDLAKVLGRADDVREFEALARAIEAAFARQVEPATGQVFVRTQTSQAASLRHGLVPPELREKAFGVLLDEIQAKHGRLSTGMFATGDMFEVLSDAGRDDLVLGMVRSREFPGYGYMLDQGATTLWEHWSRIDGWSRNHAMYSAVSAWFRRSLLGIRQAAGSVAWRDVVVKPSVVGDLTWARGHFDSVRGRIGVSWRRSGATVALDVDVPANTNATIVVPMLGRPDASVTESGELLVDRGRVRPIAGSVHVVGVDANGCEVQVGGGSYRFEVP